MKLRFGLLMVMLVSCAPESATTVQVDVVGPTTVAASPDTSDPASESTAGSGGVDQMGNSDVVDTTEAVMVPMDPADDGQTGIDHSGMDHPAMGISLADEGAMAGRTIHVTMKEFSYAPTPIEVVAGETVEFVVHNEGAIQHEFRVTTIAAVEHHIAEGHVDHSDGLEPGVMVLDPGQSGTMLVSFHEADELNVIACLIPTHYEAGMSTELNVAG
ncbi:MAG: hypothetical protein JJE47_13790 [Acidimicrobiia bacterium]|nr:hypothetical protein [Acidimicrobiia bacterium]